MKTRRTKLIHRLQSLIQPAELLDKFVRRVKYELFPLTYQLNPEFAFCPSLILVTVNDRCNLRCATCDIGAQKDSYFYKNIRAKGNMDTALFKTLIDSVRFFKPEILIVCTEPLLHPDIVDMVDYTVKSGLRCQMTTNGILLSRRASDLVKTNIHQLNISLDGGTPKVNDSVRGEGSFKSAENGIREIIRFKDKFKKKLPQITINCVISNYNFNHLVEVVSSLSQLDIDIISFSHLSFITKDVADFHNRLYQHLQITQSSVFDVSPEEINVQVLNSQIKMIKSKFPHLTINFMPDIEDDKLKKYYLKPNDPISGYERCFYPWRFAHVLPDGDVMVSFKCFDKVMGNLKKNNFLQIWQGELYRKFRKELKREKALPACLRCTGLYCSYYL